MAWAFEIKLVNDIRILTSVVAKNFEAARSGDYSRHSILDHIGISALNMDPSFVIVQGGVSIR